MTDGFGRPVRGWRPDADGVARIHFSINPTPLPGSSLTADEIEQAILAAAGTWETADPKIKFVYLGRTTRETVGGAGKGDGYTDFALGRAVGYVTDPDGYITEADILRSAGVAVGDGESWHPCQQRDDSCTPTGDPTEDMQNVLTHEIGHTLGLADLMDGIHRKLTMYPAESEEGGSIIGERNKVTLGLGDMLGLRVLYGTSARMPPIYAP